MVCSQWRSGYNDDIAFGGGCRVWPSSDTHDHADLFVLFLCWVYRRIADGTIWDINSTCAEFGPKCSHLLVIQYLTVSDTTSYLSGKGNVLALKILRVCDFPGLSTAFESHAWTDHGSRAGIHKSSVWSASRHRCGWGEVPTVRNDVCQASQSHATTSN